MTNTPLRIALIAPPWFPVPPPGYGGIEAVVALLADGLVEAGHDVTLCASGDSCTKARLRAVYPTAPSAWIGNSRYELRHALECLESAGGFDVINDHSGLLSLALGGVAPAPLVHTVHGPVDGEPGRLYERLCRALPSARLISISMRQQLLRPSLPWVATCHNAIDFGAYKLRDKPGDYLVFLGRMSPDKGAHRAIEVARETGLPLKIAAKKRDWHEQAYYDQFVRPHLSGRIEYVGEVSHHEKAELLRGARAMLFPIDWEEPFGLVMVESMACGTPVIATRHGAVPEVIEHGVTGLIVNDHREMAAALETADRLEPAEIRRRAALRFSPERMVADYVSAYRTVLSQLAVPAGGVARAPADRRLAAPAADAPPNPGSDPAPLNPLAA
jgi:glycosyltransferase involved in cell wall biosynthesis